MLTNKDYVSKKKDVPAFVPKAYYCEIRDVNLYPFPARHPDTVSILCLWFKRETEVGERSHGVSFSLNAGGYRIVETFQTELEDQVDAWLSHVRQIPSDHGLVSHGN